MTSSTYRVIVKPDDDRWHAYCPALIEQGGAAWGHTRAEALENIREVVRMVVDDLRSEGAAIPKDAQITEEPLVAVTV